MKTRRLYVMCLDMSGNKTRFRGDGCKPFYNGGQKNMISRCVRNHRDKVLEVCRSSDGVMAVFKTSVVGHGMDLC